MAGELNPRAIETVEFARTPDGYDPQQVRRFLTRVASEFDELKARADEPAPPLDTARLGEQIIDVLDSARKIADEHLVAARAKADQILAEARDEKTRLVKEAAREAEKVLARARREAEQTRRRGSDEVTETTIRMQRLRAIEADMIARLRELDRLLDSMRKSMAPATQGRDAAGSGEACAGERELERLASPGTTEEPLPAQRGDAHEP